MNAEQFFNNKSILDLSFFNFRNAITAAYFADNDLEITLARLREAAGKFIGGPATTLSEERIENCQ